MRVREYILTEDYRVNLPNSTEYIQLDKGTFLKPIEFNYLPIHIKEKFEKIYSKTHHTYCYCSRGILPVNNSYIKKLD